MLALPLSLTPGLQCGVLEALKGEGASPPLLSGLDHDKDIETTPRRVKLWACPLNGTIQGGPWYCQEEGGARPPWL